MRKLLFFSYVVMCVTTSNAQVSNDPARMLVSKGHFYTGINIRPSLGFAMPEGRLINHTVVIPKFGYFISDRLSVGVSVVGLGLPLTKDFVRRSYVNAETDLNYFFYAKKNFLMFAQAGVAYGNYSNFGFRFKPEPTTSLKLGAGVSWRFKRNPNFGINLDATYYIDPTGKIATQKMPVITVGFSYFFNKKTRSKKPVE